MSDHLARHVLERLIADDPRDRVAPAARVHVASCDRCSVRKRSLETARARFLEAHPADAFAAAAIAEASAPRPHVERASLWRRLRWPAAALALVAVVALGVAQRSHIALAMNLFVAAAEPAETAVLQGYVQRGGEAHALRDGEALREGDRLSFTYSLAQPRHLLLLGVDEAGAVTRYFPDATLAQSSALPEGAALALPLTIDLDARRGQERLVALFSPEPIRESAARAALVAAFAEARAQGKGVEGLDALALPAAQATLWFDKP